jgi:serine/threonine-protein kinase
MALAVPVVLRAAVFAVALLVEPWSADPNRIIPAWAQVMQAAFFVSLSTVLLFFGRRDQRAWSLGVFILDAGATLLAPFVRGIPAAPAWVSAALFLRTEAFQAALVWYFASVFPRRAQEQRLAASFYAGTVVAFVLGMALVAVDAYARLAPVSSGWTSTLVQSLQRLSPGAGDWFFTTQFLLLTPLLILAPLKLGECGPNDRRRFLWLMLGLAIGFLPLATDALLVTMWPGYADRFGAPEVLRVRGAIIVTALTAVPVAAAYAALVQRTLDVSLVVRTALQYVLARSIVRTLAAAPFVMLVVLVVINRERSVAELMSGPLGLTLTALTVSGVAAALLRQRLLNAIDQRFFRERADARATLLAVGEAVRQAASLDELRDTFARAVDQAFHPKTLLTAVAGSDDHLHAIDMDLTPLSRASALAQLLTGTDEPLDVEADASRIVQRLGARDREWLLTAGIAVVVPLRGPDRDLLGVLALGEKKSELSYDQEDLTLLALVGSAGGLALARILNAAREARTGEGRELPDPPARECVDCGTVHGADQMVCRCGGLLQRAAVPHALGDRLRFVRRVGSGGMGVVYRAMDVRLQQPRAVKTLAATEPAMVARLRREAKVMAALKHQNLAVLHGLELWRGSPMLVMEFLDRGTLAERLKRGPMHPSGVLSLGGSIAQALEVLHEIGMLHRDVKPSNIGFTADGTPRLLDFGLAKFLPYNAESTVIGPTREASWSALSTEAALRGTPAYVSPELLSGESAAPRDDLWSLSVSLLEAATGGNPFKGPTMAATVARVLMDAGIVTETTRGLPESLRGLFAELLGRPEERPQTAGQFIQRLLQCNV